jgi:hypothetical protein
MILLCLLDSPKRHLLLVLHRSLFSHVYSIEFNSLLHECSLLCQIFFVLLASHRFLVNSTLLSLGLACCSQDLSMIGSETVSSAVVLCSVFSILEDLLVLGCSVQSKGHLTPETSCES